MPKHVEGGANAQALPHPAEAGTERGGIDGLSLVLRENVAVIFHTGEHEPPCKLQFVQLLQYLEKLVF